MHKRKYKIKNIFFILALSIAFMSCEKSKNLPTPYAYVTPPSVQSGICIDSTLIGNTDECIEIYDPVCGCDGITYDNYCVADSSGITSYVAGKCCD
tara:strand:+ start:70 stop:357 length:288 start_codon:yes stop_codon:yes gene_type:complete